MSSNELPRPISFDEIQVDDKLRVEWTEGDQECTRVGVACDRGLVHRASVWWTKAGLLLAGSDTTYAITLLDRPVKRGPAWDAPMGSLWTNGDHVWARTDQPADTDPFYFFRPLSKFAPQMSSYEVRRCIDSLVPFSPPSVDAELERLRSNVIEAARVWACDYSNPRDELPEVTHLHAAVRAFRDHQAGAS